MPERTRYEGVHTALTVVPVRPGLVLMVFEGHHDVGELGTAPFEALARELERAPRLRLFFDARDVRGASVGVSEAWARWLGEHRERIERLDMLVGSRLLAVTGEFVRRYADLTERMHVDADAAAFERAVYQALVGADLNFR